MTEPIRGHRDSRGDSWSWEPVQPGPRPDAGSRLRWGGVLLAIVGAALAGIVFLIVEAGDEDDSSGQAPTTRSPVLGASRTPTITSSPQSSSSTRIPASPSADTNGSSRLFVWSRQRRQWLQSDLSQETPGYREGEPVPFMLRIDDVASRTVYQVELRYECHTAQGAAFDYLTDVSDADISATTTEPGPGREREDASIPVPDDATINFDGSDRRFLAWGASFQEAPEGPLPAAPCGGEKRFRINLMAHDDTLFLIWGGHLALSTDWGESQGAASQQSAIHVEPSVDDSDQRRLGVGPGAIAP